MHKRRHVEELEQQFLVVHLVLEVGLVLVVVLVIVVVLVLVSM